MGGAVGSTPLATPSLADQSAYTWVICITGFSVVNGFSLAAIGRRDEELMKQFTDERDVLESQIEMLQ